jgi:hypothetical protein
LAAGEVRHLVGNFLVCMGVYDIEIIPSGLPRCRAAAHQQALRVVQPVFAVKTARRRWVGRIVHVLRHKRVPNDCVQRGEHVVGAACTDEGRLQRRVCGPAWHWVFDGKAAFQRRLVTRKHRRHLQSHHWHHLHGVSQCVPHLDIGCIREPLSAIRCVELAVMASLRLRVRVRLRFKLKPVCALYCVYVLCCPAFLWSLIMNTIGIWNLKEKNGCQY